MSDDHTNDKIKRIAADILIAAINNNSYDIESSEDIAKSFETILASVSKDPQADQE